MNAVDTPCRVDAIQEVKDRLAALSTRMSQQRDAVEHLYTSTRDEHSLLISALGHYLLVHELKAASCCPASLSVLPSGLTDLVVSEDFSSAESKQFDAEIVRQLSDIASQNLSESGNGPARTPSAASKLLKRFGRKATEENSPQPNSSGVVINGVESQGPSSPCTKGSSSNCPHPTLASRTSASHSDTSIMSAKNSTDASGRQTEDSGKVKSTVNLLAKAFGMSNQNSPKMSTQNSPKMSTLQPAKNVGEGRRHSWSITSSSPGMHTPSGGDDSRKNSPFQFGMRRAKRQQQQQQQQQQHRGDSNCAVTGESPAVNSENSTCDSGESLPQVPTPVGKLSTRWLFGARQKRMAKAVEKEACERTSAETASGDVNCSGKVSLAKILSDSSLCGCVQSPGVDSGVLATPTATGTAGKKSSPGPGRARSDTICVSQVKTGQASEFMPVPLKQSSKSGKNTAMPGAAMAKLATGDSAREHQMTAKQTVKKDSGSQEEKKLASTSSQSMLYIGSQSKSRSKSKKGNQEQCDKFLGKASQAQVKQRRELFQSRESMFSEASLTGRRNSGPAATCGLGILPPECGDRSDPLPRQLPARRHVSGPSSSETNVMDPSNGSTNLGFACDAPLSSSLGSSINDTGLETAQSKVKDKIRSFQEIATKANNTQGQPAAKEDVVGEPRLRRTRTFNDNWWKQKAKFPDTACDVDVDSYRDEDTTPVDEQEQSSC